MRRSTAGRVVLPPGPSVEGPQRQPAGPHRRTAIVKPGSATQPPSEGPLSSKGLSRDRDRPLIWAPAPANPAVSTNSTSSFAPDVTDMSSRGLRPGGITAGQAEDAVQGGCV